LNPVPKAVSPISCSTWNENVSQPVWSAYKIILVIDTPNERPVIPREGKCHEDDQTGRHNFRLHVNYLSITPNDLSNDKELFFDLFEMTHRSSHFGLVDDHDHPDSHVKGPVHFVEFKVAEPP
jgi:hypothetical protein